MGNVVRDGDSRTQGRLVNGAHGAARGWRHGAAPGWRAYCDSGLPEHQRIAGALVGKAPACAC